MKKCKCKCEILILQILVKIPSFKRQEEVELKVWIKPLLRPNKVVTICLKQRQVEFENYLNIYHFKNTVVYLLWTPT